jgi:hypothetical protein
LSAAKEAHDLPLFWMEKIRSNFGKAEALVSNILTTIAQPES